MSDALEVAASSTGDTRNAYVVDAPIGVGVIVSDDLSPSFSDIRFRLHPGAFVHPGQFVVARCIGADDAVARILMRVLDVHETNPHEDPQSSTIRSVLTFDTTYASEGESTVIYRVARAELVEEIGDRGATEPRTLPLSGSPVAAADAETVASALGLEAQSGTGIHVGALHSDPSVGIVLSRDVAQRHVGIFGGIGSGKSYTRGVLAEELHALGSAQVNLDVQGEMIDAADELGGMTLRPGQGGFTVPLSSFTSKDVIEAASAVRKNTNYEALIEYAFEDLSDMVVRGDMSSFGVDELVRHIEKVAPRLNMDTPSTLRPALRRSEALKHIEFLGPDFDWVPHLKPGGFLNIDCRGLSLNKLRIVAAAIARDLQSLSRQNKFDFVVYSIDEFHLVAPNDDRNVSTQVLRELARIGRHHRIGLILTTQSPADVDRSILKRLLTRFIHTLEPDQLEALRGVFSDAAPETIKTLPKLPRGTCLLTGVTETIRHAAMVDVRSRLTTHGGATPPVWERIAKAGWGDKRPIGNEPDSNRG